MNDDDIRRYASLMDELDLSALEIKDEGLSVRMEKNKAAAAVLPKAESAVNAAPAEKKEAEGTFIAENGSLVEYGSRLFRIAKDE